MSVFPGVNVYDKSKLSTKSSLHWMFQGLWADALEKLGGRWSKVTKPTWSEQLNETVVLKIARSEIGNTVIYINTPPKSTFSHRVIPIQIPGILRSAEQMQILLYKIVPAWTKATTILIRLVVLPDTFIRYFSHQNASHSLISMVFLRLAKFTSCSQLWRDILFHSDRSYEVSADRFISISSNQ